MHRLLLAVVLGACAGPSDGIKEDTDTDADADTDTDSDTDTDTSSGPCAPPDAWTGGVPAALYSNTPYTEDAGFSQFLPFDTGGYGGASWMVYGATVTAVAVYDGQQREKLYLADAYWTLPFDDRQAEIDVDVGDKVAFTTDYTVNMYGERTFEQPEGWTVLSSDNPVYVHELGAARLDYSAAYSQVTHVYGELSRVSAYDCASGYTCFVLAHEGGEDLIRVANDNTFGLGPDFAGGLCAEVVAPLSSYDGTSGTAIFLEVMEQEWMRTWVE